MIITETLHISVSITLKASMSLINQTFVGNNATLPLILDILPTHCMYVRLSQIPAWQPQQPSPQDKRAISLPLDHLASLLSLVLAPSTGVNRIASTTSDTLNLQEHLSYLYFANEATHSSSVTFLSKSKNARTLFFSMTVINFNIIWYLDERRWQTYKP